MMNDVEVSDYRPSLKRLFNDAASDTALYIYIYIYKGKAVPLQAWTGPEGSRKFRLPDFVTTAQDGGRLSALRTGRFLLPGNTSGHFC